MMELRLHGALGRDFGKRWDLDVGTIREAIDAICSLKPGFRKAVLDLDKAGMVFKVKTKDEDLGEEHLRINMPDTRVDVVPIMRGAGAAGRIIAGVVLIIIGAIIYYEGGTLGQPVIEMGLAMLIGGVAQLLAPHPKQQDFKDDIKSWTINGPLNTTNQGNPVPVIYGEVLTGGIPISAGMATSRPLNYDTAAATAIIGGDFAAVARFGEPVTAGKVVLSFSVSPTNLSSISNFVWSITGFALCSSKVISGQGTATIQVTLTYNISSQAIYTDAFTVSCMMSGISVRGSTAAVSTATQPGLLTLDTREVF